MRQTWRWFGPHDTAHIDDRLQCGVEGVVSALNHLPAGTLWPVPDIARRQHEIRTRRDGSRSGPERAVFGGSLGARPDNDLPGMMRRLGARVHFLHLRNVRRESAAIAGSFHESEHLDGDVDMVALIAAVLSEEAARVEAGRRDCRIPMRPDHGHQILDDLGRDNQPGYPVIGRMRGLAELRGVAPALSRGGAAG